MSEPTDYKIQVKRVLVALTVPVDADKSTIAMLIDEACEGDGWPAPDATAWEWPAFFADVTDGFVTEEGDQSTTAYGVRFDVKPVATEPRSLKAGTAMPRTCFYIPVEQYDEHGYIPSLVTENEPGHAPLTGGPGGSPWYWGKTYEEAVAFCAKANADKGLTLQDVNEIIASSMRITSLTFEAEARRIVALADEYAADDDEGEIHTDRMLSVGEEALDLLRQSLASNPSPSRS